MRANSGRRWHGAGLGQRRALGAGRWSYCSGGTGTARPRRPRFGCRWKSDRAPRDVALSSSSISGDGTAAHWPRNPKLLRIELGASSAGSPRKDWSWQGNAARRLHPSHRGPGRVGQRGPHRHGGSDYGRSALSRHLDQASWLKALHRDPASGRDGRELFFRIGRAKR